MAVCYAMLHGGGTGGDARNMAAGNITPRKEIAGNSTPRGGDRDEDFVGSISWTNFTEENEGAGKTGSVESVSAFFASAILQHNEQGFSPLKVSFAALIKPSCCE